MPVVVATVPEWLDGPAGMDGLDLALGSGAVGRSLVSADCATGSIVVRQSRSSPTGAVQEMGLPDADPEWARSSSAISW